MAILPIIEVPDPRLKTVSEPVTVFDAALQKLIDDMFDTMYDAPGIGLAAIQVGVPKRLLVIDIGEEEAEHDHEHGEHCNHGPLARDPRVYINPEILEPSEDLSVYNEGCLSVPDQYAEVERPAKIRARWQDATGKRFDEEIEGMLATVLQHEMDHLEGILFIDHLSRLKRQMVLKKLAKARKDMVAA
ncbi:MAG: peptide deformylase [Parasphingorhabdus sp.]|nr:peptide deformylase [Parasphingorhabdus sp.]